MADGGWRMTKCGWKNADDKKKKNKQFLKADFFFLENYVKIT